MTPKELAPELYKRSRFKKMIVYTELQNSNWIKNIGEIQETKLLQDVLLYLALTTITLNDQKDAISWKWTANGQFSVASAYECQFKGAMASFPTTEIWKAISEPKHKFFAWLIMHDKAPTVDNLLKKKWSCNTTCSLCFCMPETANHLLTQCNFTVALWVSAASAYNLPSYQQMPMQGGPSQWVRYLLSVGPIKERRKKLGFLFTFWWQIWKERNNRIFENKEKSIPQLTVQLQEQIRLLHAASQPS
jgi:hypothetical protein